MVEISIVLGTRPEAIKLAPVIQELRKYPDFFNVCVISTGQHKQMLHQVLEAFALTPDLDLELMTPNQTLPELTSRILTAMDGLLRKKQPDIILVQGDTTSVFAASLGAFYNNVLVGHVEAGLRSHDNANPFPEEINRKLVGALTRLHFAPTQSAVENLLRENVPCSSIALTGNTVVDALEHIASLPLPVPRTELLELQNRLDDHRLLLVTMHRRESLGREMAQTCQAIAKLVHDHADLVVAFPVHLNPRVREVVHEILADVERVYLLPPLGYLEFVHLMKRASVILTDSGGIQEEAPTFGVPVLVLRHLTERPEAMQSGQSVVVGTDAEVICSTTNEILCGGALSQRMHRAGNPFGDGKAAQRIALALRRHFEGASVLLEENEQFQGSRAKPQKPEHAFGA